MNFKSKPIYFFYFFYFLFTCLYANTYQVTGKVFDRDSNQPIWYANVLLFSEETKKQVNGIATDESGFFALENLKDGSYYMEIHFIGYETFTSEMFSLDEAKSKMDFSNILLHPNLLTTESIQVEGNRSAISYQIDKKVISVDEYNTASSGTAVDVLENVPSVTVDIEGNVSLRGSGSFNVLIDGRPTILEPSEVLQQIPASAIDNIEIITNPSVKHDPSGAAGIINIIMKKNRNQGTSGVFSANGGIGNKYGADFILEHRNSDYRTTLSLDYSSHENDGTQLGNQNTVINGTSSFLNTDGSRVRNRDRLGGRAEFEYKFSDFNIMSVGIRAGKRTNFDNNRLTFTSWTNNNPARLTESNVTDSERGGGFYALFSDFQHKFNNDGHVLLTKLSYRFNEGDEETLYELFNNNNELTSGQLSTEKGPSKEIELEIEYTLPFSENGKFEAGYEIEVDDDSEDTSIEDYNLLTGAYEVNTLFSKTTSYKRNTQSVFGLMANEWNNFGLQGGIRGEYTGREIYFSDEKASDIDRWDFFPSVHSSYKFEKNSQIMGSYSRRINRPRGWFLEPFETWTDALNVRVGNPDIQPEYIDSYEAGFLTYFGKALFSTEFYFRNTKNKVEFVRSSYPFKENTTLQTIQNIGEDFSLGSELLINFDPVSNWNVNLIGNLYNYRVEGIERTRESFTWNTRFNNKVKFSKNIQFQVDGIYNSPSVSSQGKRESFFITNAALRFDFFDQTLSTTFQVRDIFATGKWEFITDKTDYYNYYKGTGEAPVFMLNVRYTLNNFKNRMRDGANIDDMGEGGGEEGF
jgi:outer membrane receptor protein involved in Fe transport